MNLPARLTPPLDEEQRHYYAGIYALKMIDLGAAKGGADLPVLPTPQTAPLEPVLDALHMDGLLEIDRKKQRYKLTRAGLDAIAVLIDEIEQIIEEFDEAEIDETIRTLRARGRDVLRVRFLWGWYDGEFDDVVAYQRRRGLHPIEADWPAFITSPVFFEDLARDLDVD